jgi:hypothetical protein
MQTTSILNFLRAQKIKLQTEARKAESQKSPNKLNSVKKWGIQFRFKLLKSIHEALWVMHLLKTSILVTRTPFTTLKSLSRSYFNFNPASISNLKERTFRTINEIREALVGNLQLHSKKHKRIYDKPDLKVLE